MHFLARTGAFIALIVLSFATAVSASPLPWPQWPLPNYAPALANGRRGMNPASEFGLFYNVRADMPAWYNVDAGQVPWREDIVLVSALSLSLYPRQGPHMIENYPGGRTAYYATFLPQLQALLASWIPQEDYNGLLVLDYEYFCPWWTGHWGWPSTEGPLAYDYDFTDDWRDALRVTRASTLAGMNAAQQEAYFKQEWMATTREFFERVAAACRAVRPQAKLGIYNQPTQDYWSWIFPDRAFAMKQGHDEVPWFWQLFDVIVPSIYPIYYSVPDNQTRLSGQDHQSDFEFYVRNNIAEAIRCANGKPVYPYISFVYHPSSPEYGNQPCNDFNLRRPLEISREMGCNGAVVWGWFRTQQQYDTMAPYFTNTVCPWLTTFSALPAVPPRPNPCPADVGSQGGVPSQDGDLNDNDFVVFVNQFFGWNYHADVGKQGGLHGPDGVLDTNDFVVFIDMFMNGCHP
jgi:hypothetical protein